MYVSYKIAERIKDLATNKGLQIKDILEECQLSKNQLSSLYNGNAIKAESLAKIADVLECSLDYLMGRTDIIEINRGK